MNLYTISEHLWKRDPNGQTVSGVLSERIIYRRITGINTAELGDLAEALRLRSSVKNPDDGKRYYVVEDPLIDGVVQKGIWFSASVKDVVDPRIGPGGTITQALALWNGALDQVWATSTSAPGFVAESITETVSHIPIADLVARKATFGIAPAGYVITDIQDKKSFDDGYGDLSRTRIKLTTSTISGMVASVTENAGDYTQQFGLVTHATTVFMRVGAPTDVATLKAAIKASATKLILSLKDDDDGHGTANVICIWRSKPAAQTALSTVSVNRQSSFHNPRKEKVWIDLVINSTGSNIATEIAKAIAGTAPYTKENSKDIITGAIASDAGDKTATIKQSFIDNSSIQTPADYSGLEVLNPHGLQSAIMGVMFREYPEVCVADAATTVAALIAVGGWMRENSPTTTGYPVADTNIHGRIQVSLNGALVSIRAIKEGKPGWLNNSLQTTGLLPTAATGWKGTERANIGGIGESFTGQATGVPVENAAAKIATLASGPGYGITRAGFSERGAGEAVLEAVLVKEDKVARSLRIITGNPTDGATRNTYETIVPLVLPDSIDAIWATAASYYHNGTAVVAVDSNHQLEYRQKRQVGLFWEVTTVVSDTTERKHGYESGSSDTETIYTYKIWDRTGAGQSYDPLKLSGINYYIDWTAQQLGADSSGHLFLKSHTSYPGGTTTLSVSDFDLDVQKNRFGKYDIVLRKRVKHVPTSCSSAVSYTLVGPDYYLARTIVGGLVTAWWKCNDNETHEIKFHVATTTQTSAQVAAAYITGSGLRCSINEAGGGIWMTHKITTSTTATAV